MATRLEEYITLEGRITNDIPEGYHGIAFAYSRKRIDLGSVHYQCKTNMSIPHKVTVPITLLYFLSVNPKGSHYENNVHNSVCKLQGSLIKVTFSLKIEWNTTPVLISALQGLVLS